MIDTINIYTKFATKNEYDLYYSVIDELSVKFKGNKYHLHKDGKRYVTTAFYENGFLDLSFKNNKRGHILAIKFKPALLLHGFDNHMLCESSEYNKVERHFNEIMYYFNSSAKVEILPFFSMWNVSRIDYSKNIYATSKDRSAQRYINLLRKGYRPPGTIQYSDYDGSFGLETKEYTLFCYDKSKQLMDRKNKAYDMDILRVEVQCHSRILNHMKEKYDWGSHYMKQLWEPEIIQNILKTKIKSLIGKNNFYSKEKTFEILREKFINNVSYVHMKDFIKYLAKHKDININKAKLKFIEDNPDKNVRYVDQLLFKMNKAGINPITIPTSWDIEEIKNPLKLI